MSLFKLFYCLFPQEEETPGAGPAFQQRALAVVVGGGGESPSLWPGAPRRTGAAPRGGP